jgi:hypothetical protein
MCLAVDGHHLNTRLPDPSPEEDRRSLNDEPERRGQTTGLEMMGERVGISLAYDLLAVLWPMVWDSTKCRKTLAADESGRRR